MALTKVLLGDILFTPGPRGKIQHNNPRNIAKIDIPGGAPVQQDMGEDETTLSWSGSLVGDDAYQKALQIEALKDGGQPVQLTVTEFPELSKEVRVRNFTWELYRADRVDYSIDLVVEVPPPPVSQTVEKLVSQEPAPHAAVKGVTGKTYTVKQGDTLWAIATKHLGAGTKWREIATANNIIDPKKLRVGQTIIIPIKG